MIEKQSKEEEMQPIKNFLRKAIPLFFHLVLHVFPDIELVVGLKKKETKKKITRSLRIEGPGTPGQRLKLTFCTKIIHNYYTVKNVPVFVPVFLYAVTNMLIFQIERIISSDEKWFNYIVTFFFGKCQKIGLVRQH